MKKQFVSLLAFCCTAALAAPESVADFDIEGFKLGMDEAAASALYEKKCSGGPQFKAAENKLDYDILRSKSFYCFIKDTDERIQVEIEEDKITLIMSQRAIDYPNPNNLSEADKEAIGAGIYDRLLEKYGKPTHEVQQLYTADFTGVNSGQLAACWGDCTIGKRGDSAYQLHAGEDLYAVAIVNHDDDDPYVIVSRALADIKGQKAAKEAFEQAVEAAQKQEEEETRKRAEVERKQVIESIQF